MKGGGPSPFKLSQTQESPLWTSHHLPEFRRKVSSLSPKFHFSSARGREEKKWVGHNSQENIRFFIFDNGMVNSAVLVIRNTVTPSCAKQL